MRNLLILVTFLLSVSGCRGWTAADQADYDRHCPDGSCSIQVTKESSTNYCDGLIVPIDCHKENPNQGSNPTPKPGEGNENGENTNEGEPCKTGKDCPGSIEGGAINTGGGGTSTGNGNGNGNGDGGGFFEGAGDVLTHWGKQIGKGWEGIKGELNGNNAENRRKKREAKHLLSEMRDLWKQAEGYGVSVDDDRMAIEGSWGLLNDSWKEFGIASREKDLEEFRGRYNSRTSGILDGVPVADPSVFDGLGKGRGEGIYPEHRKVENGRKYLAYARGKLDPNAADYEVRKTLVDFGDAALDEAESSYRAGNVLQGNAWYEMGMAAADAALSLTPGVGWAKDIYEATTGKSLLTGKKLSDFERTMAAVGALTGGIVKLGAIAKAGQIFGIMATTAKSADEAKKISKAGREAIEIAEAAASTGDGAQDAIKWAAEGAESVDDVKGVLNSASEIGINSKAKVEQAKKLLSDYLGDGTMVKTNESGDKIFLSKDGARKARFDVKNPHGDLPHMHLERQTPSGRWVDEVRGMHRIRFDGK